MGSLLSKGVPDPVTGMTERERRGVEQSWSQFVKSNPEYGVVMFAALFEHHPDFLKLFPAFRGKQLKELEQDAKFRAHGCAVGYQLSSMVDSMRDPVLLEALIRKNATAHLVRKGVGPFHFQRWTRLDHTGVPIRENRAKRSRPQTHRAIQYQIVRTVTRTRLLGHLFCTGNISTVGLLIGDVLLMHEAT
ncbi:hypothetical protein HPB48_010608 [Haemaphysalis longicornis]|uniref:Globin domain-containing protein n=1 Tax=Haemaphysalis longicornis TaxID=44386 RepID=A0A9J6GTK6_HAELO|nr:hypothetical protein HPB48_010608 [Haemaphysalis longicornis]